MYTFRTIDLKTLPLLPLEMNTAIRDSLCEVEVVLDIEYLFAIQSVSNPGMILKY